MRRLFSTSPRDPRYHMLSHLSSKFNQHRPRESHEPRAALFLNRYTRTLTIMYATNGLADVLGVSGEEMRGKSFYFCIAENCLGDAVRCLENAKANDSIAYLRFWFRDPRQGDRPMQRDESAMDIDGGNANGARSSDDDVDHQTASGQTSTGRVNRTVDPHGASSADSQAVSSSSSVEPDTNHHNHINAPQDPDSRASSGDSNPYTHEAVFGESPHRSSSASSVSTSPQNDHPLNAPPPSSNRGDSIELEAVVSCTSDGLVVCLRRAGPPMPVDALAQPSRRRYENGLFAVPWSSQPILPPLSQRPQYVQHSEVPSVPPPAIPYAAPPIAQSQPVKPSGNDFMSSIREIGVFAWALNGINGSLAQYSRGVPRGESQPAAGLPIWQPEAAHQEAHGFGGQLESGAGFSGTAQSGGNPAATGVDPARASLNSGGLAIPNILPPPNFSMPLTNSVQNQSSGFNVPYPPR